MEPAKAVIYRTRLGPLWSGNFDVAAASKSIGSECVPLVEETISLCQKIPQAAKEY